MQCYDKLQLLDRYTAALYAAFRAMLAGRPDCTYHSYRAMADLCRQLLHEAGYSREAITAARQRADEAYRDLINVGATERTRCLDALVVDLLCLGPDA
jgi:hypothetical protein